MIPIADENPTRGLAYVNYALLVGIVLVFLWQLSLDEDSARVVMYALGLVPASLFGYIQIPPRIEMVAPELTVFTSMFLHGGLAHMFGNFLYLFIFGDNVEEAMGHWRYLCFYFICGIAAAMAQALPAATSTVPMVGASGAISGVLGAYLLLYPRSPVVVLVPLGFVLHPVRMPAFLPLALWFLLQLVQSLFSGDGAGVAFRAHIGGFIAGLVITPLMARRLWDFGR